jgi:replicative DNA helicase
MILLSDSLSERLIIGTMIRFPEAVIKGLSILTEDHFDDPGYQYCFKAIKRLVERDQTVDIYSMRVELSNYGNPLSLDEIVNIQEKFFVPEAFESLMATLEDVKKRRETTIKLRGFIDRLKTDTDGYDDIIKDLPMVISEDVVLEDETHIIASNYREARKKMIEDAKVRKPILTGFDEIDDILTYKLPLGEISVIAARPQNGKSLVKANFIVNQCKAGVGVANYALEQTKRVESDRIDALVSGLSIKNDLAWIDKWASDDARWDKLNPAWDEIQKWNYHLLDGNGKSDSQIQNELRFLASEGVEIVYFDLFDRLASINSSSMNTAQRVKNTLNKFLTWSKRFNQHYCLLVQINREAMKQKGDIRPKIHHLKESGAYEEFARLILLLHNPSAHDNTLLNSPLEIDIAKQNNGPLVRIELPLDRETLKLKSNNDIRGTNFKHNEE